MAVKNDSDKLRVDLVPKPYIDAAARGFAFGAKKYSDWNWTNAPHFGWSRLYGSLMRHLTSWWDREDFDPESALSHLDHAAATLAMLRSYVEWSIGQDDRRVKSKEELLNELSRLGQELQGDQ